MEQVNCIVVIDDDKVHRYLAEKAIREAGIARYYQLLKNGEEGIQFIRQYRQEHGTCPSMIFLDTFMPVMDAYEFIEEYNQLDIQRRGRDGAIILMCEEITKSAELMNRLGISAKIEKPLKKESILENYYRFHKVILHGSRKDIDI